MGSNCFKGATKDDAPSRSKAGASTSGDSARANGLSANGLSSGGIFRNYTMDDLLLATSRFSEQNITSEGGRQAVNVVYRGQDPAGGLKQVAIKRFSKKEWEDSKAFLADAHRVSQVAHPSITALLGCCCEGDDKLLVAEFMEGSTLAQHLFHWEKHAMAWPPRLNVAVRIAQALDYLTSCPGSPIYHDLTPYRVLFSEEMEPKLSCFGLMKPTKDGKFSSNLSSAPPELFATGVVTPSTVVHMFGSLLLSLFSGKSMRPLQFVERVNNDNNRDDASSLLDSQLVGKPGVHLALELVPLIADCLQPAPERRPQIGIAAEFLEFLQSHGGLFDSSPDTESVAPTLSFSDASKSSDFDELHQLLMRLDAGHASPTEAAWRLWNSTSSEALLARLKGLAAFNKGAWEDALDKFKEYERLSGAIDGVLLLRRSYAHMRLDQWGQALEDAKRASAERSGWVEASCIEALALRQVGRIEESEAIMTGL